MTKQDHQSKDAADLRQKAEALAREQATRTAEDSADLSPEKIRNTLHELRVHQIELEIQNEELRRAQEEIEAGRARYFDLYDMAPVGYCTLSEQGIILEANLTAAKLLGTTRGMLVKQPISRFILKDDQDIYYLHRKKLFETGEAQEWELRLVKPDGAVFWARLDAAVAEDPDGALVCRVVLSDITEHKQAEAALQRVRFSIENLSEGVFWVGETGCFTDVNAAACRKLGYTREELLTMSVADIDPCFSLEQWAPHWEEMKQCGMKVLETVHRAKNGNLIPMELVVHNQLFENQRYNCVLGRDITERKQAENSLRESEARFRHLLQHVQSVAVQGYGPDGTTRYWNEASEHLYGYTEQEAIGRNLIDLIIPAEMRGEVEQAIQQMAETGQPIPASEVSLMRKDGSRLSVFSSHATVQIPGQAPELFCIDIDITERMQAEEKRDSLQAQLTQAQKLESVGRLAGGIAHDFNNMLSVILGYGEILFDKLYPGDPLRDDVKEIVEAGRHSATLTRQLLAFSRKQTLQPEELDLNTVIRNTEKMLRRLIGEDIELELAPSDEIDRVMADQGQIEQVIMNLSINARDAMPRGGKLILETANVALDETYAKSHASVHPGKYVMLAVSDTGCGMDKETLTKIFEPFFTTKEMGKGTGLGLATVYGIVKQSGGNIWAYSEPGRGTTFKIYLPQTQAEQEPKTDAVEKEAPKGGGEHILVVEDEDSLRKLTKTALSRLGYKVSVAANGGEALLLMEKKGLKPDLVLTDVVMPNMSGKELVNHLRRNQPDLKVLYMSGYADNAIVHHGFLEPGTAFLQKPFTIRGIAEKVQAVLRRGGAGRAR